MEKRWRKKNEKRPMFERAVKLDHGVLTFLYFVFFSVEVFFALVFQSIDLPLILDSESCS